MRKSLRIVLLGAVTVLGLSGFTHCDNRKTDVAQTGAEVTFDALATTGENGYKINVDINVEGNTYNSIDYYFCTGLFGLDYFAKNSSNGPWLGEEPDVDYGNLDNATSLDFISQSGILGFSYSVISADRKLIEDGTYDFIPWIDAIPSPLNTIYIRSISDFNCTQIASQK